MLHPQYPATPQLQATCSIAHGLPPEFLPCSQSTQCRAQPEIYVITCFALQPSYRVQYAIEIITHSVRHISYSMLNVTSEVSTRHPIYPMFNAAPQVTRRPLRQDVFHAIYNVYLRITFDQVYQTK